MCAICYHPKSLIPRKYLDYIPMFLIVGGSPIKGFHILLKMMKDLGKQGINIIYISRQVQPRKYESFEDPEPYMRISGVCNVNVVRRGLERDELSVNNVDCVVFIEFLEHLHYYYMPLVLGKIIMALKPGGVLILTTPSIVSLFKRLRLLLGVQPIYQYREKVHIEGSSIAA
jgi:SAM-dependent methyltransferase